MSAVVPAIPNETLRSFTLALLQSIPSPRIATVTQLQLTVSNFAFLPNMLLISILPQETDPASNNPVSSVFSFIDGSAPTSSTDVPTPTPTSSPTFGVTQPISSSDSPFTPAPSSSFATSSPFASFSSSDSTPNASTESSSPSPSPSPSQPSPSSSNTGDFTISTILTTIDGQVTTIYSEIPIPTSLAPSRTLSPSRRTAVIVSTALGTLFLLLTALFLFFLYKRRQQKAKMGFTDSLTSRRKREKFSRAILLQGEDLDDIPPGPHHDPQVPHPPPHHIITSGFGLHSPYTHSLSTRSFTPQSETIQVPRLLRARGSETGSIFHEGVWPPPGEHSRLVDPLIQASSQVDLSTIVDDVMGPPLAAAAGLSESQSQSQFQKRDGYSSHGDQSPTFSLDSPTTPNHDEDQDHHHHGPRDLSSSPYVFGHGYDWSNTSQTRLWSSDSIGQSQPRYSSPLAQSLFDGDARYHDRASISGPPSPSSPTSPRNWLERSPVKRISRLDG